MVARLFQSSINIFSWFYSVLSTTQIIIFPPPPHQEIKFSFSPRPYDSNLFKAPSPSPSPRILIHWRSVPPMHILMEHPLDIINICIPKQNATAIAILLLCCVGFCRWGPFRTHEIISQCRRGLIVFWSVFCEIIEEVSVLVLCDIIHIRYVWHLIVQVVKYETGNVRADGSSPTLGLDIGPPSTQ